MTMHRDRLRDAAVEMYGALLLAREFIEGELAHYLDCACVIDIATMQPKRETLDPADRWFVEGIEARLRAVDKAIASATGAGNDNGGEGMVDASS